MLVKPTCRDVEVSQSNLVEYTRAASLTLHLRHLYQQRGRRGLLDHVCTRGLALILYPSLYNRLSSGDTKLNILLQTRDMNIAAK